MFQANTGHYICHNKYYGRRLSADGVEEALIEFLHNGYGLRIDLIESMLDKLRKLYSMLAKQNKFRFYSSSLLIMYDGSEGHMGGSPTEDYLQDHSASCSNQNCKDQCSCSPPPQSDGDLEDANNTSYIGDNVPNPCRVDVRMIDFAHATHQGFRGDRTVHTGPDEGYLFGLENIIRMLESLKNHGDSQS